MQPQRILKSARNLSSKGFTLIETLVAVSILLLAIAGPLTIAARGLFAASAAKDQTVAFFLAQEGIEIIRSVRDTNGLNLYTWTSGLPSAGDYFTVDSTIYEMYANTPPPSSPVKVGSLGTGVFVSCPTASNPATCPTMTYNTSAHSYGYGSGGSNTTTRFKRYARYTIGGSNSNEMILSVTVEWSSGVFNRSFTLQEVLFNWQN